MKHYKKIEELVEEELEDYGFFKKWELNFEEDNDEFEFYTVDIWVLGDEEKEMPTKTLRFQVDENDIHIEGSEDCYTKVCGYDHRIKYFWMALLSWEI